MTWAKLLASLLSLVKPLVAFFIYLAGKRAATKEIEAAQAKEAAAKQTEYAKIASDNRTDSDTVGRLQDGTF